MDYDKSSNVISDCGDAHSVVDSTQDPVWVGLTDSSITRLDWHPSSNPPIYGISIIHTCAQCSHSFVSLHESSLSAPIFFLLYLLPPCNSPNFLWCTAFLHPQSFPSFFIASFPLLDNPPIILLLPLCAQIHFSCQTSLSSCVFHITTFLSTYSTISRTFHAGLLKKIFLQHCMIEFNLRQIL